MNTTDLQSGIMKTPWSTEEELYAYVSHKRTNMNWSWDDIKNTLIKEGLDEEHAESVISSLQEEEVKKANEPSKGKGTGTGTKIILSIFWAVVVVFFIKPIIMDWSPEYGRYILLVIIGIGINAIRNMSNSSAESTDKNQE